MDDGSAEVRREHERQLREKSVRGARAQAILEDEMFREAVSAARESYRSAFEQSALDDDKARYHARVCIHVLEDVITHLANAMKDGEHAEWEIRTNEDQRRVRDAEPGEQPWQ